jgi:hypothetical protein
MWVAVLWQQVKLDDPSNCLDSLFVFSLVWSVGASCDRPSALRFDAFLRQLLAGRVQAAVDRSDFDLGPGLAIKYPEQLYAVNLPEVRARRGTELNYRTWAPSLTLPQPNPRQNRSFTGLLCTSL